VVLVGGVGVLVLGGVGILVIGIIVMAIGVDIGASGSGLLYSPRPNDDGNNESLRPTTTAPLPLFLAPPPHTHFLNSLPHL
jgi:hypothetical protein